MQLTELKETLMFSGLLQKHVLTGSYKQLGGELCRARSGSAPKTEDSVTVELGCVLLTPSWRPPFPKCLDI